MNWTDKYSPKSSIDIVGQDEAVGNLRKFLTDFKRGKAAFLYGPVGCGKTSLAYALSNELNMEILEINASDCRNKNQIEEVVGNATKQHSLIGFGRKKVILVDEADGMSGHKDRGGISTIAKLVASSTFPIVVTANDPFSKKLSALRKKSSLIELNELDYEAIFKKLQDICELEKVEFKEDELRDFARRSGGDLRAAITDLQLCSLDGKFEMSLLGDRKRGENIKQALLKIFKTTDVGTARSAFYEVDEDLDKRMLWLEENLPREYEGEDLERGFDALSKADMYLGRIRRWQHWRFLIYADALMSAGIAVAKEERYKKMVNYRQSERILKIWIAKMKYKKREEIASKIAKICHTSTKRARDDILPYIQAMSRKGSDNLKKEFDFSDDEINWLSCHS